MPYVIAAPEPMAAAAADLATIGSSLQVAYAEAAAPTVALVPAAADEVSATVAQLFSAHAEGYQALAGHATAFHEHFSHNVTASAHSYATAEGANASSLRSSHATAGTSTLHNDVRGVLYQLMTQLVPVPATWEDLVALLVLYLSGRWGLTTLFLLILRLRSLLHV